MSPRITPHAPEASSPPIRNGERSSKRAGTLESWKLEHQQRITMDGPVALLRQLSRSYHGLQVTTGCHEPTAIPKEVMLPILCRDTSRALKVSRPLISSIGKTPNQRERGSDSGDKLLHSIEKLRLEISLPIELSRRTIFCAASISRPQFIARLALTFFPFRKDQYLR